MTPQITKIEEKIKALQRKINFLDVSINRRIQDIEASIDLFKISTKIEFAKIRQLPSMVQYVPFDENDERDE